MIYFDFFSVSTWSLLTVQCWSDTTTSALNIFISDINPLLLCGNIFLGPVTWIWEAMHGSIHLHYSSRFQRVAFFLWNFIWSFAKLPIWSLEAITVIIHLFKSQQFSCSGTAGVVHGAPSVFLTNVLDAYSSTQWGDENLISTRKTVYKCVNISTNILIQTFGYLFCSCNVELLCGISPFLSSTVKKGFGMHCQL